MAVCKRNTSEKVRVTQARIALGLIFFAAAFSSARGESLKDTLKMQYQQRALVLRSPFQEGTQEFDSDGKPLKGPPAGEWTMRGAISTDKISANSHVLSLDGSLVAVNKRNKNDATVVPLGKPVKVEIRLTHALRSMEEAREILNRVFFLDEEVPQHSLPEYQRPGPFPEKIYHYVPGLRPPRAVFSPEPDYTEKARRARLQGDVVIDVVIDEGGTVARISIERPLGMELDQSAVDGVKQWRFLPAVLNGNPVAMELSLEINFNLHDSQ